MLSFVIVSGAAADPSPSDAIAELNQWRGQIGELPVSTVPVAAWNTGCQHHVNYEQLNGQLGHVETSGNPGYTADGAVAGSDSVLAEETSSAALADDTLLPGPIWDAAVFHRAALLQPRLANTGFNSTTYQSGATHTSWQCLWIQNGPSEPTTPAAIDNSRTTSSLTLYPSPANGSYSVPTTFPEGTESPDPAAETGVPSGARLGWLMNVEINGPWTSAGFGFFVFAHGVSATLRPDGTSTQVPLVVSQCGPSGCGGSGGTSLGEYFGGGFGIFPTQPLAINTRYRVTATGTVTDAQTSTNYPFSISWCFSTGTSYATSSDCAALASRGGLEAIFVPRTLHVGVSGKGSVSGSGIACPGTCAHAYTSGTRVTLIARPAANQRFVGWTGSCTGSGPACTLVMAGNASVGASFALTLPPSLSHSVLSLGRHPSLAFSAAARAGATPLQTIVVSAPRGISFARSAKTLARGIVIKAGGKRVRFSVAGGGRSVRIKLAQVAASARVMFGKPALVIAGTLARRVKHHGFTGTLSFSVHVTDQGARTTKVALRFTFH